MLSEIAHHAFQADRLFLPKREITDQIEKLLEEMLADEQFIDGAAVLKSIEVQHGVLVERAEGIYSFSHLTLQEYLTAQYIDDHRQIEQLVSEHLTKQRWREVFLLVAGLMRGGADELLLLMEKEAQEYIITPKLQALLHWAEQATAGSESDLKPVAKRAIALALANAIAFANINANTIAIVIAFANGNAYGNTNANTIAQVIADAITIVCELKELKIFKDVSFTVLITRLEALKAKIPDEKQPKEAHRTFVKRWLQTWLVAFNLPPELINLSEEEAEAWKNYFYANYLIIQCKEAAVRVSPKTWAEIEERMLLVPGE